MRIPASFYEEQQRAKAQARALRSLRVKEVEPGLRVAAVRVDGWLGGHRFLFPDERSDSTKHSESYKLRPFRRRYGSRWMHSITAIEAQAWTLKHPGHVRFLRLAWDYAVQMQVVPLNVWKLVTMPRSTRAKRRPPTAEELDAALYQCAQREWFPFGRMVTVAAYTGARQAGLITLRRCDVDLNANRMELVEKGSKRRTVVLAGDALKAMQVQFQMRERHGWQVAGGGDRSPLVFVNSETDVRARHRPMHSRVVQLRWAGVRGEFPHGFHSLRHYAVTWLAALGVDECDIAIQLGHTDSEGRPYPDLVQRIYNHPSSESALERIDQAIEREAVVV